jgi:hypothetical protein
MSDDLPSYRLAFPGLTDDNHTKTSPEDKSYNCMGHATNTPLWWNPVDDSPSGEFYWPPNAPRENSIRAYRKALECVRYKICENENFESGFEKIAIFAKDNMPTHMARQLDEKFWTSKLGRGVDISHTLRALYGLNFGEVVLFMKKAKQ